MLITFVKVLPNFSSFKEEFLSKLQENAHQWNTMVINLLYSG